MTFAFAALAFLSLPVFAQLPADAPERAELEKQRATLGEKAQNLAKENKLDEATKLLEERLKVEEKLFGKNGFELADTYEALGYVAVRASKYAEAAGYWEASAKFLENKFGAKHWRTLSIRAFAEQSGTLAKFDAQKMAAWTAVCDADQKGQQLFREGKFAEAVKLFGPAVPETKRLVGEKSPQYLLVLGNLGIATFKSGAGREAIGIYETLVVAYEKAYPEGHPQSTVVTQSLGWLYYLAGQFKKAEPILIRTLAEAKAFVKEGALTPQTQLQFLSNLTKFYGDSLNIADAAKNADEALEYAGNAFGKSSEQYYWALMDAAQTSELVMDLAKADKHLETAELLALKIWGKKSEQLVEVMLQQGELLNIMNRYPEARKRLEAAIAHIRKHKSANSARLFQCRQILAGVLDSLGEYTEAVRIYEALLKEKEKESGKDRLPTVGLHVGLGNSLLRAGNFSAAEASIRKAYEIAKRESTTGMETAVPLAALSNLYQYVGDMRGAEAALFESRAVIVPLFGENHPLVTAVDTTLGEIYIISGDPRRAELVLRKVVQANREALGDHLVTAKSYASLGRYYSTVGNAEKSREAFLNALRIMKGKLPPGDSQFHDILLFLGQLGLNSEKPESGTPFFTQAVESAEKAGERQIHRLADALVHRAMSFVAVKKWAEAEAALKRAEQIWLDIEKANPGQNLNIRASYAFTALAFIHGRFDRMADAEKAFAKSQAIVKVAAANDPGETAFAAINAAMFYVMAEQLPQAAKEAERAVEIGRAKYSEILGFASESEMLSASNAYRGAVAMRSYIALLQPENAAGVEAAYLALLQKNGQVLDALCQYRELERREKPDEELSASLREYRAVKQRLANATLNPQAAEKPEELKNLEENAERLQAKIHRRFTDLHPPSYGKIGLKEIRSGIPAGAALVEFTHLDVYVPRRGDRDRSTIRKYAAFVVPADAKKPVQLIDLGKADDIENAIKALEPELQGFAPEEEARRERQFKRVASKLYERLMAPLEPALEGAESLIIAPDAAIHHVPFAALVDGRGKYLIENQRIRFVTGGRDLLHLPNKTPAAGVAVFADPDYGSAANTNGLGGWKKLEHTRIEANAIAESLKKSAFGSVTLSLGAEANEANIKKLHSPKLLHLATHGTFVQRSAGSNDADRLSVSTRQMAAVNPLLRSAIILAGANTIVPPGTKAEDGILTADEVAFLDLAGTELVVLSACESGLGDLASGEGVLGLRRAFFHAGARSVIASLYPVPDKETSELMASLYRELAAGKGKATALHTAQLAALKARRGDTGKGPAHPLYWAAFALIGEGDEIPGALSAPPR